MWPVATLFWTNWFIIKMRNCVPYALYASWQLCSADTPCRNSPSWYTLYYMVCWCLTFNNYWHSQCITKKYSKITNRKVSYFRFSAFCKDAAFGGGRGALKAAKLFDDNVFVYAAANEGRAPYAAAEACLATVAGLDGAWTAEAETGRATLGKDMRCWSTICNCCGVTPAACIA